MQSGDRLQTWRLATGARRKLRLHCTDLQGRASARTVRPLGSFLWGQAWTLSAWCEQRQDFSSVRVDRIGATTVLDERFRNEPGRSLDDLLRQPEGRPGC